MISHAINNVYVHLAALYRCETARTVCASAGAIGHRCPGVGASLESGMLTGFDSETGSHRFSANPVSTTSSTANTAF
jgi:hypothetical protein